jgi:sulfide dehydrogenase cytochrome subunit
MKKQIGGAIALLVLSGLAATAPDAMAVDRQVKARSLAATCANCHGTNGRAERGNPVLAGMPKDELMTQMRLFREGAKPSTIMGQISKGYTPEQVEMIAEYFAAQKR